MVIARTFVDLLLRHLFELPILVSSFRNSTILENTSNSGRNMLPYSYIEIRDVLVWKVLLTSVGGSDTSFIWVHCGHYNIQYNDASMSHTNRIIPCLMHSSSSASSESFILHYRSFEREISALEQGLGVRVECRRQFSIYCQIKIWKFPFFVTAFIRVFHFIWHHYTETFQLLLIDVKLHFCERSKLKIQDVHFDHLWPYQGQRI